MTTQAQTKTDDITAPLTLSAWRVRDFDVGAGEAGRAFEGPVDGADWIDATAPGDIYLALHAAGRAPHPFEGMNEATCAWIPDREWWWRASFEAPDVAPGERLKLTFLGLDTLATVWLNGEVIGRSETMFVPARFDITARVRTEGPNVIAVRFTPTSILAVDPDMPEWASMTTPMSVTKRNLVRKAQFGWGWDWGPTLPTVGLWRAVTLEVQTIASLETVRFATLSLSEARDRAQVVVDLEVDAFAERGELQADIVLAAPSGVVVAQTRVTVADGFATAEFELTHPELWWIPDLGAPALYDLDVALKAGDEVVDRRSQKVGVRTIALDQSPDPDEPDASFFRFVLNGVPIFARGVCWIPASSFVAAVDEDHYRRLLEPAVRANMNMIRIWGGGVYEHDAFYDLCDQLGLLVWQDFMFACAPYPEHNPAFVSSVTEEVRYQIRRLRNHPAMALWCGNNENQMIQDMVNHLTRSDAPLAGALYYDQIMPAQVAVLDPTTPYWPGSPSGGPRANSMLAGDVHDWTVWHGMQPIPRDKAVGKFSREPDAIAYTRYAEDMARFVSEYGIQASPVMETLKRALSPDERVLGSPAMLHRIKDRPKDKMNGMMLPVTGLPATLDDYVDFTQITQAEGLKFAIEHFRRRKPHCSGSLIWQWNDCWPGVSWSLIDYYGFGKAGLYYVARAYAPVMASFKPDGDDGLELWIVNDTLSPAQGACEIELSDFTGDVAFGVSVALDVGPNQSARVWRSQGPVVGRSDQVLTVKSAAGLFPDNRHLFVAIKDLDRSTLQPLNVEIEQRGDHELAVHLTAPAWTYFVHLLVADEHTIFSDNYFDLRAGELRTVTVRNPVAALTPGAVTVRCR
jgi:beta-mannosidase